MDTTDQPAATLRTLHDLSGLTILQLARALGVAPRSLRLWLQAALVPSRVRQRALTLLTEVAELPATTGEERRRLLLAPQAGGRSIYDRWRAEANTGQLLQPTYPPLT